MRSALSLQPVVVNLTFFIIQLIRNWFCDDSKNLIIYLIKSLRNVIIQEERCDCAESLCSEANVMRSALEEVARALIHDSETDTPTHMHISSDRLVCIHIVVSFLHTGIFVK